MSLSLLQIKKEIQALPVDQMRELTGDLIEEISAEDFPTDASFSKRCIAESKNFGMIPQKQRP